MIQTLVKETAFDGKFVAMKDFDDNTVVSEGFSLQEAHDNAQKKGIKDPVIVFVPQSGMVQIY
ncbi:MAG: DUF5678 domain-containing protein [Candidatus Margulisiibacteriota bacterium]